MEFKVGLSDNFMYFEQHSAGDHAAGPDPRPRSPSGRYDGIEDDGGGSQSPLDKTVALIGRVDFKLVREKVNQIKFELSKNLSRQQRDGMSFADSSGIIDSSSAPSRKE